MVTVLGLSSIGLYANSCTSSEEVKTAQSCKINADCKSGRVCNVQKGVCEDSSLDVIVERNDVYDAGVQRRYDITNSIDSIDADVSVKYDITSLSDVVLLPETYVDSSKEIYVDLGSKDQGYDVGLKVVKGDVNCDGKIDAMDVDLVKKYLVSNGDQTIFPCSSGYLAADVNCDGEVTVLDMKEIKKKVVDSTVVFCLN